MRAIGIGRHAGIVRAGVAASLMLALSATALAYVQEIRPRRNGDWGRDGSRGQFDIRLRVDDEVEVAVRGDRIRVMTVAGRGAFDVGSEYSAPLPRTRVRLDVDRRDGRGRVWLVQEPAPFNGFTAILRIRDDRAGDDRYHVRLRFWADGDWRDDRRRRDDDWDDRRRGDYRWERDRGWGGDDAWYRPSSWGRMPGVPLDPRFRRNEGDFRGSRGGRFEFRGRIDEEVIFFLRGNMVTVQNRSGRGLRTERWSLDQPLPVGRPVRLELDREDGRGRVQLLEEPNPRNNYTAVVRVFDPSGGSDRYHLQLDWRY